MYDNVGLILHQTVETGQNNLLQQNV